MFTDLEILDLCLPSIEENLALDEALLLECDRKQQKAQAARQSHPTSEPTLGGCLRIWEFPRFAVVLGKNRPVELDVHLDACRRDQVVVARRSSGGGTVLLGPGCLCFSLILPMEANLRSVAESYQWILERTAAALDSEATNPDASTDLAIGSAKICGNSQQRKRDAILHHGCILNDFPVSPMERYLKKPDRRPSYRGDRSHREFVTSLKADREALIERLVSSWSRGVRRDHWPQRLVCELVENRYATEQWLWRATPVIRPEC